MVQLIWLLSEYCFKSTETQPSTSAVASTRPQVSPSDDEHTRESGSRSDSLSSSLVPDSSSESTEDLSTSNEVIDHVVQAICSRFDQDGYKTLSRLEKLLCDAKANLDDFDDLLRLYDSDFNKDRLATQLCVLHSNIPKDIKNEKGGMKLKSIINFLQCLSPAECQFYSMVMQLVKLILVMPATNAISERSFSALRRLKTWLRSTMHQSRLNWCMLLHVHCEDTDKLDLTALANEFIGRNASRYSIFGNFV